MNASFKKLVLISVALILGAISSWANADPCADNTSTVVDSTCDGPLLINTDVSYLDNAGKVINTGTGTSDLGISSTANITGELLNSGVIQLSNLRSSSKNFFGINIGDSNKNINALTSSGSIYMTNNSSVSTADKSAIYTVGIYQSQTNTIETLTNTDTNKIYVWGTEEANGNVYGISNFGTIGLSACGGANDDDSCQTVGLLKNSGIITVITDGFGTSRGVNNGSDGSGSAAIYRIDNIGTISVNGNSQTIADGAPYGPYNAIGIYNHGNGSYDNGNLIGSINNSGSITSDRYGIQNNNAGRINYINNTGVISITSAAIVDAVTAGTENVAAAIINVGSNIGSVVNSGSMSVSGNNRNGIINYSNSLQGGDATITSITNTGSIAGSVSGGYSIVNAGIIGTLNNSQGTGNASGALTYYGYLPTEYNIIINSADQYGQLAVTSGLGTTTFGISSLSTTNSSILNTALDSVLSGVASSLLLNTRGTSNGFTFELSETTSGSGIWNLLITSCSVCAVSDITAGTTVSLDEVGADPILSGGTLALVSGDSSNTAFSVTSGSTIQSPTSGSATLSGVFSGVGGLTFIGTGSTAMSGANSYTGGTTVSSGTLVVAGASPTGMGDVFVASAGTLMGTGTINGQLTVAGILKPGNSPGYLSTTGTVTMNTGSGYLQDIAGTVQASSTSPVGASGYYSFLNVSSGQFVIQPGVTLAPRLSNLFSVGQSGYGSVVYVPSLGDRMRIVTAAAGISGRFSSVTQPAELAAGTQFLPFYNMADDNSIDLAVIPTSYQATIASGSGNANAQSVGGALTKIAQGSLAGTATAAQDQLLYAISSQTSAQGIASFAQSLSGEVYAANVVVTAQATQRMQQTVLNRLGGSGGLSTSGLRTTGPGTAGASTSSEQTTFSKGNVWGEVTYQRGDRSSDDRSGGWNSNLFQLTFGSDLYTAEDTTFGAGFSLSNTTMNPVYGSSTVQQGALFAYGKMPVGADFVLDAIASIGLSSSDISRNDITGLSSGFRNKSVSGNDALIGLGLSRAFETSNLSITPFARVTWQVVTQSGVNEGQAASALSVDRYTGNGVRGVLGLAAGSKVNDPMSAKYTYRGFVGVGVDSSALLNPTLNASIVGIGTNISTPNAGKVFVQAGLYGTAKMSNNTFAYAGISGEARSGQTLGTINVGLKVQF